GSVFGHSAAILVLLDRRASDNRRHGSSEWDCRGPVAHLRAMETEMSTPSLAKKDAATDHAIALTTRGLTKTFGSLPVAPNIEIKFPGGARDALILANGAGKTTLINLMTGMLAPNAGQILLGGKDVTALGPQDRVRRGLARTFQINTLFAGLNALEAVTLAVLEQRGLSGQFWRGVG